jgi:hypothetical protein
VARALCGLHLQPDAGPFQLALHRLQHAQRLPSWDSWHDGRIDHVIQMTQHTSKLQ